MKNPMIEANINEALFEAIDENEINGGVSSFDKFRYTNFGLQCGSFAVIKGITLPESLNLLAEQQKKINDLFKVK